MSSDGDKLPLPPPELITSLPGILLPYSSEPQTLSLSPSSIESITPASQNPQSDPPPFPTGSLLALPSLCHPHLHLDKPYLLSHPDTAHLRPETGSFSEALSLTGQAKPLFTASNLRERMDWLLASSSRAGVTHARCFAEVDATVGFLSLDAALAAKNRWAGRLAVQVCAFAQDPIFSGKHGDENRRLMEQAVAQDEVQVIGATPYVEDSLESQARNIEWAVETAVRVGKHLDLHLDYNVDPGKEPAIWKVLEELRRVDWSRRAPGKTVCLGHCTRLTKFGPEEWARLKKEVQDLPLHFVGLPTSDLFMMGRPSPKNTEESNFNGCIDRLRCTSQVPAMIAAGFDVCIGVNNVGNAFTPHGSADPLSLAQWGVGLYQVGTPEGAEVLFDCVSTRAKEAIGVIRKENRRKPGELRCGSSSDIVLFGRPEGHEGFAYRRRRALCEVVWDAGPERKTVYGGRWISTG